MKKKNGKLSPGISSNYLSNIIAIKIFLLFHGDENNYTMKKIRSIIGDRENCINNRVMKELLEEILYPRGGILLYVL